MLGAQALRTKQKVDRKEKERRSRKHKHAVDKLQRAQSAMEHAHNQEDTDSAPESNINRVGSATRLRSADSRRSPQPQRRQTTQLDVQTSVVQPVASNGADGGQMSPRSIEYERTAKLVEQLQARMEKLSPRAEHPPPVNSQQQSTSNSLAPPDAASKKAKRERRLSAC